MKHAKLERHRRSSVMPGRLPPRPPQIRPVAIGELNQAVTLGSNRQQGESRNAARHPASPRVAIRRVELLNCEETQLSSAQPQFIIFPKMQLTG
jgi:hypothetical protein